MSSRILVVEDEARIADFLVRGLKEEGYAVEHAGDGRQASHRLRWDTWDLVLLDWRLPIEDGLEVLQKFRQYNPTTPVLFLTARDAIADRVTGLDAGADDYLVKPFSFDELLARVRALLRRPTQSDSHSLELGDIRIDLDTQRASRGGNRLELTAKELSLLTYFMRNAGKVVSRTRIYQSVWDENFDGTSNTLEVHVKELRRKLEAYGPRVIQSVAVEGMFSTAGRMMRMSYEAGQSRIALFLGALAVILASYSTSFYAIVRGHMAYEFHNDLYGSLNALVAAVEVEPEEVQWQPAEHSIAVTEGTIATPQWWIVLGDSETLVEASPHVHAEQIERAKRLAAEMQRAGTMQYELCR